MAFQAAFKSSAATQRGHKLVVTNDKGDWTIFGDGPPPMMAPGSPLTFDATSKPMQNGKKLWIYSNLQVGGGTISGPTQQYQAPKQRAANGFSKSSGDGRQIFITGVVGRAMGSGSFSANDIKLLTLAAAEAWDSLGGSSQPPIGNDSDYGYHGEPQ